MEYPIDKNNPLLSSTGLIPDSPFEELGDFDIANRMELIKATAPFYAHDMNKWRGVLDELYDWVYSLEDSIEFCPDVTEG